MAHYLDGRTVLLIITGGIAAYKSLDLIRRLRERGAQVRPVMTAGAQQFVTPLAVGALAAHKVHVDLFDRDDEVDVGHIRLARDCDLILVAPATADFMAKMANGLADDLASTCLLATRSPVLIAPAMNPAMWNHAATQRNLNQLIADGVRLIGPDEGEMAESGEAGRGRMAEPDTIADAANAILGGVILNGAGESEAPHGTGSKALAGRTILVTAGPTHEPIDPVRYIANRSSGKQGYAIANALAKLGADVSLVTGPTNLPTPDKVKRVDVETAVQMQSAVRSHLPVDAAIFAAAVADWRVADAAAGKIKKTDDSPVPDLELVQNPDILAGVGTMKAGRPGLVVGFAAETSNLLANAHSKLMRKGADWIVANDVSTSPSIHASDTGVMGGDSNTVHLVTEDGHETWPTMDKHEVAQRLANRLAAHFADQD
ncbi:MAG: bifunctional phosphopantothenoylcysteine decarboxylase/phosphopantothenate--cysteine ligase CoaBC [Pseudomonadota bacterium]